MDSLKLEGIGTSILPQPVPRMNITETNML